MVEANRSRITVETALYLGVACLALAVRLWGLGLQPLSDGESHDALLAVHFVRAEPAPALEGDRAQAAPNSPLLFSLTSLAFLLFGASDATARLAPALAGAALALTPRYLRRELGATPALVMAGLLAISPTLIAASRTADAAALAALAVMLAIGALTEFGWTGRTGHLTVAAAAVGALLACGPRAITGVVALGLGLLLWRLFNGASLRAWVDRLRLAGVTRQALAVPAAIGAAALIAGSSALLLYRPGLAAAAQAIPVWLAGWLPAATSRGWLHLPGVLIVYEPLVLALGLAGLMSRFFRRRAVPGGLSWGFAGWSLAAMGMGLAYSARASEDVVWVALPLVGLSAVFLVELLSGGWSELDVPAVAIHAALVILLLAYAGLNLASFGQASRSFSGDTAARLGLAAVSVVLIALVSLLFGVGWSAAGAARGLAVGVSAALLFAGLSAASHLVSWGEQTEPAGELWHAGPPAPVSGLRLLVHTLEDVSDQAVGAPNDLAVVVNGPPTGQLAWALRDFHAATFTDTLAATISAPAVIASAEQATPELGSAYVGQSFAVRGRLDASTWGALDWLDWLTVRRAPNLTESVVLWVRSDVHFKTDQALVQ